MLLKLFFLEPLVQHLLILCRGLKEKERVVLDAILKHLFKRVGLLTQLRVIVAFIHRVTFRARCRVAKISKPSSDPPGEC